MADPALEIRDLRKSFGALKATDGVSLELRPGEIHALIGPNGAGKSTLIAQIAGGLRPDSGSVRLFGREVTSLGAPARARRGLARSFQISSLAGEFSALRNAMLAVQARAGSSFRFLRPTQGDRRLEEPAMAALARVGLADRAAVPAALLSHGERRRLELALALAMEPKLFLLDEPMAGLGAEGSRELTGFLSELRREAPILLVEHDMDAVFALADRISVLEAGRVIASGSPAEIRADAGARRAYLGDSS